MSYRAYLIKRLPVVVNRHTCVSELVARTSEGLFAFDPRDEGVGWRLAVERGWEAAETAFVKRIVGERDLVIDVGANLGWYTIVFSRAVGPHGGVIAFEPHPRNHELLTENIRLNRVEDRVTAYQVALADTDGTVPFELAASNFGDHRIRFGDGNRSNETEQYGESGRSVISVPSRTLDNVLLNDASYARAQQIKLVKLDCQGAEIAVLKGAPKALTKTQNLMAEYWPYGLRRSGNAPEEFLQIIAANFARFARVRSGEPQFKPISTLFDDARTVSRLTDYLFVK
jgi:FkbM family methyltransferase